MTIDALSDHAWHVSTYGLKSTSVCTCSLRHSANGNVLNFSMTSRAQFFISIHCLCSSDGADFIHTFLKNDCQLLSYECRFVLFIKVKGSTTTTGTHLKELLIKDRSPDEAVSWAWNIGKRVESRGCFLIKMARLHGKSERFIDYTFECLDIRIDL